MSDEGRPAAGGKDGPLVPVTEASAPARELGERLRVVSDASGLPWKERPSALMSTAANVAISHDGNRQGFAVVALQVWDAITRARARRKRESH